MKDLERIRDVCIQRPIGGHDAKVLYYHGGRSVIPNLPATGGPALLPGIKVVVVIQVEAVGDGNLALVAGAFDLLGLGFGAAQCWQQHSRQNGNNRDDDQQFDQSEPLSAEDFRCTAVCGRDRRFHRHQG
jgi:hypothetical protein